jgi:hypothetical protein
LLDKDVNGGAFAGHAIAGPLFEELDSSSNDCFWPFTGVGICTNIAAAWWVDNLPYEAHLAARLRSDKNNRGFCHVQI